MVEDVRDSSSAQGRHITLTLPMAADMELTASKTACALGEHIRMSADKVDEVRMAVVEACINAFEHSKAENEQVRIDFRVLGDESEPDGLEIAVRDSGVGFMPDQVAEPAIEEKLKSNRKRGWGLKIIGGLMDEVNIESDEHGTVVTMRKMR
ncbi:MAG: ATP-binding protein [Acidobacteriota bacterium]